MIRYNDNNWKMRFSSIIAFFLVWIAAVPTIVAAQVVYTTTASSTIYVEPETCDTDEFACGSGICVPSSFVCDGYDDCGNMDDESVGCQPECPTSSEIPNCFTHIRLAIDNENTEELNFTMDNIRNFYLTHIAVSGNISDNNWVRFIISTDSSSVVMKWNSSIRLQFVNLKSPLSINAEESFTISVDITDNIYIQEWRPANVTFEEIIGIQLLHSCKDSTDCFKSFNNASSVDERFCTLSILERFLQEQYKHCVDICEAESLDDPIAGLLTFATTNITQRAKSEEVCPPSSTREGAPRATRFCAGHMMGPGTWKDPVLNCCETDGLESLKNINVTENNVVTFSMVVACKTNTIDLGTDELVTVSRLLEKITSVNSSSKEVTINVIEIVDNVLDLKEDTCSESVSNKAPFRILQALEKQLFNLHQGADDVNFTAVRSSVGVVAVSADKFFNTKLTFGNFFSSEEQNITESLTNSLTEISKGNAKIDNVKASITLPKSLLDEIKYNESDKVPLTFIIHRPSCLFVGRNKNEKTREEVESLIISATIEGKKIQNLKFPVVTRFHLLPVESKSDARRCVFWNASLANGTGAWSSQGCELISGPDCSGAPIVECSCNHLTHFAILITDTKDDVLDVLIVIGCVLVIISLLITIVANLAKKELLAKQPQRILINLCFALLGLYFSFLIGINLTNRTTGCIVFGVLIHFFCLSSAAWMSVETTNMYLMYVKILKSGTNNFMKKAALLAWGIPLVLVVVLVAVKPSNYACEYCFPTAGSMAFNIGVVATISVMFAYNMVMLVFVITSLTCRRQFSEDDSRKETTKRTQNAVSISLLLGLSWLFGFLAVIREQFIFSLLFLILSLFTALCIFLLFCMRSQEVRSEWRKASFPSHESQTKDSSGIGLTGIQGKQAEEDINKSSNTQSKNPTAV